MRLKTNQLSRLKLSERRLASLLSHLPGFVYRCKNDPAWTTLYISERCSYVTGYGSKDFLVKFDSMYNEIIVPEYQQYVYDTANEAIQRDDFFDVEYPIIHKSGETRWVHERGKGVCDSQGTLLFIEGYVEDISLSREARHALIVAKEKAEESDRLKTAFLANMSHEIRTPMNGILGFLELLKEPDLSDENKNEFLDLMNLSGKRLLNTINDIIEISKIESGRLASNTMEVDLRELFRFYIDFFRPEAELKNLNLFIGRQIELTDAMVIADKHKLDGILTNLIKNAIKFTKSGFIEVNNALEGNNLLIWVKDTGKGIPAHKQPAVFDRFMQAENNYARDHEGSGLGLAIVKAYVDTLKGTIWLESEEGKGSTFFVKIPYVKAAGIDAQNKIDTPDLVGTMEVVITSDMVGTPDEAGALKSGIDADEESVLSKKTILIAEDDDISFTLMKRNLQGLAVNIIRAVNGRQCVESVKANPEICLVLMDIKMPEMDGYEATGLIKRIKPHLPIIAQTAYALEGDRELALAAGCVDYISKPVSKETLLRIIEKYG
jgi:PAS domain S-box-containing protein